ncbi:hypothetical protein [Polynucleobacter sp. Fuers-14]|uniref:hypothetical protein n=1 Tax=Polynucleobacter sp. Fuers-14 TaxID=1758364 RepID=UPI001C0B8E94|nr:hypothetical protein [Polynucleobacter sp. Fuers-14]MBU3641001.1 hypothetical protein [Polynucleobacter sp. Fuers-14]
MSDKFPLKTPGNLEGLDVGQRHMRVEAALSKLVQDFPNSGYKALFDAQKKVATPTQIDILSHPDRAMATPDGQLTELGAEAFDSAQKKINDILNTDFQKALIRRNIEIDRELESANKPSHDQNQESAIEQVGSNSELSKANIKLPIAPSKTIDPSPNPQKQLPILNKSVKKAGPEIE